MDWIPLGQEEYNSICQKVNYLEIKNRPGRLYQEVSKLPCTLESKVKFILQHWGWDGHPRDEGKLVISQINNFCIKLLVNLDYLFRSSYMSV